MGIFSRNRTKQIIITLVLCLSFALPVFCQVELVRPSDFRYYVTVNGDTVSSRSLEYKAIEDAMSYKCKFPKSFIIVQPTGIEVRGDCLQTKQELAVYDNFSFDGYKGINDDEYLVDMWAFSSAETAHTTLTCGKNTSDVSVQIIQGFMYRKRFTSSCKYDLRADVEFRKGNQVVYHSELMPNHAFQVNPTNFYFDFSWPDRIALANAWGDLEWVINEGQLSLTLPTRNIARTVFETVPSHRNIQIELTEVVDTSHSTGIHLGMRSSMEPQAGAVETYIHSEGLGISIFADGQWSNPYSFPFEWEYGVPITYKVKLEDDTISFNDGTGWKAYTDSTISQIPKGYLMIGSTGAGLYIVDDLKINILE